MSSESNQIDQPPDDPYRPPTEISGGGRTSRPGLESFKIPAILWLAVASMVVVAGYFLRPLFADFEVELPVITRFLLHPVASVLFFATAATVILSGLAEKSAVKRNRLGRIALVLGLVAILVSVTGLILPVISLTRSLA